MKHKLATLISRLFEPMVTLAVITVWAAVHFGLQGWGLQLFLLILVVGLILPIVVFRYFLVKKGHVVDWDIHKRRERIKPLLVLVGFVIFAQFGVRQFVNSGLSELFFLYFIWIFGFFLITLKEKLSGHVGAVTLAGGLLIQWYGWGWWPVFLLPVIVGWARVVRKDHTLRQVILGWGYSLLVMLLDKLV